MELFTIDTILPAASGILFITQAIYHLGLYNKLYIHNKETVYTTDINAENPPLSVIIVAKDAADELQENLPFILEGLGTNPPRPSLFYTGFLTWQNQFSINKEEKP